MTLTGTFDLDAIILNHLSDEELKAYSRINPKTKEITDRDEFWISRIRTKYPKLGTLDLSKFKVDKSWKELYGVIKEEALCLACKNGEVEMVKELLNYGANLCYKNRSAEKIAREYKHPEILKLLKKAEETNALDPCKTCDNLLNIYNPEGGNIWCEECSTWICSKCVPQYGRRVSMWADGGELCLACYTDFKKKGYIINCESCGIETGSFIDNKCFDC